MRKLILILLILEFLVFAQEAKFRLVTDDDFPPYSYIENGELSGFDIDIISEVEKRTGIEFVIETHPWAKVLLLVEKGLADGAFSLFKTPEREELAKFAKLPMHYSSYHVFTNIGDEFEYNSPVDLIGRKVGINRDFSISAEFDALAKDGTLDVIESEDSEVNFFLLRQGRIDCYIANDLTVKSNFYQNDFSMLPTPVVKSRGAFLVFSKKSQLQNIDEIREKIDQILDEMYNDGTIDEIIKRY